MEILSGDNYIAQYIKKMLYQTKKQLNIRIQSIISIFTKKCKCCTKRKTQRIDSKLELQSQLYVFTYIYESNFMRTLYKKTELLSKI